MTGKMKRNIGFTLMPFAFLFLFEPSYALIDPIPDFLGYIILCISLINLADINPKVMEAFSKFRTAAILSVARFVSVIVLESYFSGNEKSVISLVFIFVFAVFDAVILISAYRKLFEGLLYLGTYYDGSAVYQCKKEGKPNASERMSALCVIFVVTKNLLWALPEFTTLITDEVYEFVNVLRLFAAAIIVPLALFWLVRILIYISNIKRDVVFIDNLKAFYIEKTKNSEDFFSCRVISIGLITLTVAFVLSFDLFFDNLNIVSDVWMYLVIILGAVLINRYSKRWIPLLATSILGIAASVFCDLSTSHFFSRYLPENIIKDLEAYNAYYFMFAMYIIEALVFCLVLILSLALIYDIYSRYSDIKNYICSQEFKVKTRKFKIGVSLVMLLGVLSALAGIYYVGSLPYFDKGMIFELSAVISRGISLIFVFAVWYFISFVKSAIKQNNRAYLY